jgi:hypothetical protein
MFSKSAAVLFSIMLLSGAVVGVIGYGSLMTQNASATVASGGASFVGPLDHTSKGLAFVGPDVYSIARDGDLLRKIDPDTGVTISSIPISLEGFSILGGNGLATDPTEGSLYALLRLGGQTGRELVTIDPDTGIATSIGNTGMNFAGLAFDASGTLYGVTGSRDNVLYTIDTTDASSTLFLELRSGYTGVSMAYNSIDGFLYYATGSGSIRFDRIDLTAKTLTPLSVDPILNSEITAFAYRESNDSILWGTWDGLYNVPILSLSLLTANPSPDGMIWVRQVSGSGYDQGYGVAVNSNTGNAYVVGSTEGIFTPTEGGNDAFISAYNSNGVDLWHWQFGTDANDVAHTVSVNPTTGNVYVAGQTDGALLGQTSSGGTDAFISMYNSAGVRIWTKQFGTSEYDAAYSSAVNPITGDIFLGGQTRGTLPGQTSSGDTDIFVSKFDSDGNPLWTRQFGSSLHDSGNSIAVNPITGTVYAAGFTFGALPGQSAGGAFIRAYDSSGNELWTAQFSPHSVNGISVDPTTGNIFAVTAPIIVSGSDVDCFVSKFDSTGVELWTIEIGTNGFEFGSSIAVDISAGDFYIGGQAEGTLGQTSSGGTDAFLIKFDSEGAPIWIRQFSTQEYAYEYVASVAVNQGTGDVYVGGLTWGVYPGETTLGSPDAFIAKFDSSGVTPGETEDTTPPILSSISDSPDPFSPNGDGIDDIVTISFASNETGEYTIMILTSSNEPVQNLTGSMNVGENSDSWDGLRFDSTLTPDGTYKYMILAHDTAGNYRPLLGEDGTITVDSGPSFFAFDRTSYALNDTAILTFVNAESNLDLADVDTVPMRITSTSDPVGIGVILLETGIDTGVFVLDDLQFTTSFSNSTALLVSLGDTITAIYFPSITATATIGSGGEGSSINITSVECFPDPFACDPPGQPLWGIDQILVEMSATVETTGNYILLLEGYNETGSQNVLSWISGAITAGSTFNAGLSITYGPTDVGTNTLVAKLISGTNPSGPVVAQSGLVTVIVQKHPAELVLSVPSAVTAGTGITASGKLVSAITGEELSDAEITFDNGLGGATPFPTVRTAGVTFAHATDPNGVMLVKCEILPLELTACTPDNIGRSDPNANDNVVLHLKEGGTITFDGQTAQLPVEVKLFIQNIGTRSFTLEITEGNGAVQPLATFSGSNNPIITTVHIVSGVDSLTGTPNGIREIEVTAAGVGGETVGIAALLSKDPNGNPQEEHAINFEEFAEISTDLFSVNSGSYFSTGLAQDIEAQGLTVQAHFAGNDLYHPADSSVETYGALPNTNRGSGSGALILTADVGTAVAAIDCSTGGSSDSDEDAVCDYWESIQAVDFMGTLYPLTSAQVPQGPIIGVKDLYLEIDAMNGYAPGQPLIDALVSAFAAKGIALHVVLDEIDLPVVDPFRVWTDSDADQTNDYDSVKKNHFGTKNERALAGGNYLNSDYLKAKAQVYHYALFVKNIGRSPTECGPSGQAELNGNDIVVSLGCGFANNGPERQGTLMHELGHNLGLRHGGGDDDNCKPNHISVMSYSRQMPWTYLKTSSAGTTTSYEWYLGYSSQALASLNEDSLNDGNVIPINSALWGGIKSFKTIWGTPTLSTKIRTGLAGGSINWNGNSNANEVGQQYDINRLSGVVGCDPGKAIRTTLKSYDEWSLLNFNFRNTGSLDGFVYPDPDAIPELTPEIHDALESLGNTYTGIQQPINTVGFDDRTRESVFKKGSTIPVKFQLHDEFGNSITDLNMAEYGINNIKIRIAQLNSGLPNEIEYEDLGSSTAASSGDTFRYDAASDLWIYNLGTKDSKYKAPAEYAVRIFVNLGNVDTEYILDDNGDGISAIFGLRK